MASFASSFPTLTLAESKYQAYVNALSLDISTAASWSALAYWNATFYGVASYSTVTSTFVSGTFTNGDTFSVTGTNLTGYPYTVTRLVYTFQDYGVTVILDGSVTFSSPGAEPTGTISNAGGNLLDGRGADDTLDGAAGADTLLGGGGNDTLTYDAADARIDGGGDNADRLLIQGSGVVLDLSGLAGGVIQNVEIVDLSGSGDNTLGVSLAEVLAISSSTDTLRVDGNAGDVLSATDATSWVLGADVVIGSNTYHSYTQGSATLLIDSDIAHNLPV